MVGLTLVHTILLGRIKYDSNIPSYICNTFLPKLSYSFSTDITYILILMEQRIMHSRFTKPLSFLDLVAIRKKSSFLNKKDFRCFMIRTSNKRLHSWLYGLDSWQRATVGWPQGIHSYK